MDTSKKRILICGASGFIGRNLFETLSSREDFDVYGTYLIDKFSNTPNLFQADLTKREDVENILKRGFDVLIQAAATTSGSKEIVQKPYYHVTDNVIMNALLYQAAFLHAIPQVIFFSCTVMYPPYFLRPVQEIDLNLNEEIYHKYFGVGWTKVYLEKLCEFYSRLGKTKFTVIRHSNIYGPHDKFDLERSHVFGATITKVMTATDKVVVWGDGKEERDLLYVSDLVDFVTMVIDHQHYDFDVFNVGLGQSITVDMLVKKIIEISEKKLSIEYDTTKPTIPTKLAVDFSKAKKYFGWSPKVTIDEGIQKTLAWYKEHIV